MREMRILLQTQFKYQNIWYFKNKTNIYLILQMSISKVYNKFSYIHDNQNINNNTYISLSVISNKLFRETLQIDFYIDCSVIWEISASPPSVRFSRFFSGSINKPGRKTRIFWPTRNNYPFFEFMVFLAKVQNKQHM